MGRLKFNPQGRLVGADGVFSGSNDEEMEEVRDRNLKTSDSLSFLKQKEIESIKDESGWSLWSEGKRLEPLKFSNGKTQEDIVDETVSLIKKGHKVIFIHGVCGTGKSAIALNIARRLGKASVVVPVKGLQRQYEEDYSSKRYLVKPDGKRLTIAMITGRENHDSIIKPGVSCADHFLPDTIKITEKNFTMLKEYYMDNPLIKSNKNPEMKQIKRISVAPANPYWSPIASADYELPLKDAKKKSYIGLQGRKFIFYHRKEGCSYYDQYQAYIDADVIIFNAAKFLIETALDRRPEVEVDIIDEADEFLDSFSTQEELNLSRLVNALQNLTPDRLDVRESIDKIIELIKLEEKNKQALGVDEEKIYKINETKIDKILELMLKHKDLEAEISLDELNYGNAAIDVAKTFAEFLDDTYLTYRKKDADLIINLVTTNLSKKFAELQTKSNALVLMSGTLHSKDVLKNVFGIEDYQIVEAETLQQGTVEIHMTGKEFDCKYSNFSSKMKTREDYLKALEACMEKAKKPVLIHVNSFEDLPSENDLLTYNLKGIMSKERLHTLQFEDKTGKQISMFKSKLSDSLFTTKCSRGVDFPGDICNSVIYTKYPNPNVNGIFWKILQKTHAKYFWDFYRDKARREFLQRLYRAIRSKNDHVYVLSPDLRVLQAVKDIQLLANGKK